MHTPPPHTLLPPPPLLFLLSLALLSTPSTSQSTTHDAERQTLLLLKSQWGNPPALHSWSAGAGHCNWTGIKCDPAGFVTGISLPNQNLNTPIPPSICQLNNLSYLDLSFNYLPGDFPTALYNCSSLRYLDLSENNFVSRLPADIHRLPSTVTYLSLNNNNFTGDVPLSICRLPRIVDLRLHSNLFNGSYPAELGNLSTLQYLTLAYNPFAPASIPPQLGHLTQLTYLWMTHASITGEIPAAMSKLTNIEHLDLGWNSLTGPIPEWIWMLPKLKELYLYHNKLSGEIAGPIGALGLVELDVSMNKLTGPIPEEFGRLQNLSILFMYYNQLTGGIPASIGRLPMLSDVRLFNNSLTGPLPPELGQHSWLRNLEVSCNHLTGELPRHLCARNALAWLVVYDNHLSGEFPASLAYCRTLGNIQLYKNNFSGEFPSSIWSAANLSTVLINDNAFSGTLPANLPWNLTTLRMSNNRFSGNVPLSAGRLIVFTASYNLLSGEIPGNLAEMSKLQVLSLDGNRISGQIPATVSALTGLTQLNLSSNQLSGDIPATIGSLPVLTTLDLSDNQLSGSIPPEMDNLKLDFLNLSSNQLSGEIPASLTNQVYDRSFLANPGLCSPSGFFPNLRQCRNQLDLSRKVWTKFLILFLVLGALAVVAIATIALLMARDHRWRKGAIDITAWKLTSFRKPELNEYGILRGLTKENLIGRGGCGMVYKIRLEDSGGETVAVKKICGVRSLEPELEKQFEAEVKILGLIRHANIVKLLCCLSSSDAKLLVYEYMENGSLDRWLHDAVAPPLDWPTRLGIAIDAARGLCYMHHDFSPPVVHRDIKSSNILLDSEFKAKVADFGLAHALIKPGEPETVSAMAGTFGYIAPEYGQSYRINEKVDVYSFGVVLLELTTGRRANEGGENSSLAQWAARQFSMGSRWMDAINGKIWDPAYLDEIGAVFRLGLACTSYMPAHRPAMKEVVQALIFCGRAIVAGDKSCKDCDGAPLLLARMGSRRRSLSDARDEEESDSF